MPELTAFQGRARRINIAQAISVKWDVVGTTLLDDHDHAIMPALAQQYSYDVMRINMEVLGRWVQGQGMADCTWRGLLGVLKVHCRDLAKSVEEALTEQEDTDPPPMHQPDHTPPPPGRMQRFLQFFRRSQHPRITQHALPSQ